MKIESKNWLLNNGNFVIEETKKTLRRIHEVTPLRDTAQGWFKESLAVYFTTMVSDQQIEMVEKKLAMDDAQQASLKPLKLPAVTDFKRYGLAKNTIPDAITHLAEDVVLKTEKKFYYNAISIAKLIRGIYGGKLDPKKVDMGEDYDTIRANAVKLAANMGISGITTDKWCPADIFIYNNLADVTSAKNAKYLNVDIDNETSLNGLFQAEPELEKTKGIFGISLKEQVAQAGAASSFKNILTREQNYPDSDKIENIDALSVIYHLDNFKTEYPKEKSTKAYYFANLAYAYASALKMISRRSDSPDIVAAGKNAMKAIDSIFKSNLGDKLPPKTGKGFYEVNKIRSAFEKANVTEFKVPKSAVQTLESVSNAIADSAIDEYTKLRKKFLADLKTAGYNPPTQASSPAVMRKDIKRTLAKAGCYKTASYVLKGMSTGLMNIPSEFSTIAKQKNVFVAMVAYAVGMAGISPTFFKVVGSQKPGGQAHMEAFYGNGYFHLDDKSEIEIIDRPTIAGFSIEFIAKVTKTASKSSKTVQRYQVIMTYRAAGDQIAVQVNKLETV